ncbi:MAG: MFS transporter [Candidatus Korobacteraceae bacterium]
MVVSGSSLPGVEPKWKFALRAFRHRNYRLFFAGQGISLVGNWMTWVATNWLVYRLTESAFLLGVVGFAGQIPLFLLGPLAGVWVDRLDRRRVLVATQALAMFQSLTLAALAFSGHISIHHIIALSLLQGCINAFDMPARQAFVVEIVESRQDLGSAIALNSTMVNGARLIGPFFAGILIGVFGEAICYLLDGLSYIAVIFSLLAMRIAASPRSGERKHVWSELKEGFSYASGFAPIRSILLLLATVGLFGMPYSVLLPVFAGTILHGGPKTLGLLMGAAGIGAVVGVLQLAARRSVLGLGRVIASTAALFGAALIAFAFSRSLWLSLPMMVLIGYSLMQQLAGSNTFLQTIVEENKRGRVMSFYTIAIMGMTPVGSLFAGSLASRIGAPETLLISGLVCIAGAAVFAWHLPAMRVLVRPIYVELGIIPEVASGLQSATALQTPPED